MASDPTASEHQTLIEPRHLRWFFRCGIASFVLLASCDRITPASPQAAWEETMQIRLARDYAGLWESLAQESQDHIAYVLAYVKRNPRYGPKLQAKLQIDPASLATMDPAAFFVTLMNAVEQSQPQIVDLQMKSATGAKFIRTQIKDDRAVVSWLSGTGKEEQTLFVREDGEWRPVLQRN